MERTAGGLVSPNRIFPGDAARHEKDALRTPEVIVLERLL